METSKKRKPGNKLARAALRQSESWRKARREAKRSARQTHDGKTNPPARTPRSAVPARPHVVTISPAGLGERAAKAVRRYVAQLHPGDKPELQAERLESASVWRDFLRQASHRERGRILAVLRRGAMRDGQQVKR